MTVDVPTSSRWPIDRETVRLLGAYVSDQRARRQLSPETFVQGMNRNEEWLAAVERGEVELTREMVVDIGVAFHKAGLLIDVPGIAQELRQYPYGERALELRELTPVGERTTESDTPTSGFGLESIAGTDRLLVVAPTVIVISFLTLIAKMLQWSVTSAAPPAANGASPAQSALSTLLDAVLVPSVVVATLAIALGLVVADRVISDAARRLRPGLIEDDLTAVDRLCEADGIIGHDTSDWRLDFLAPHLVRGHRRQVASAATRAAFSERAVPALVVSSALAIGGVVMSIVLDGIDVYDIGPFMLVVIAIGLCWGARRVSIQSSGECVAAVSRGLGWKLQAAKEKGVRLSLPR